jgi:hypothetical protein
MPVAVNCAVVPRAMLGLVGVTWIEDSVAEVTVSVVLPETIPDVAVIVVEPSVAAVARPLETATVAIVGSNELHVTEAVRFWFVPSEKIPVAVNCLVVPRAMLGLVGVTWIEDSVAEVTVSVVVPDFVPTTAVIAVDPGATAVARPLETATVAIVGSNELHVTEAVRSWLVPSEKIPVAVNCLVVPRAMRGLVGVTWSEFSVAEVTVSVVLPETVPDVAVMVVEPAVAAVARPLEPCALLIVAIVAADELQVTDAVISWLVLSEKIPVAMNCLVIPSAMLGLVGATWIDASVDVVTVSVVLPETPPVVAVIVVEPAAMAVASPLELAVLLTVAVVDEELQVTDEVMSWLVLSE